MSVDGEYITNRLLPGFIQEACDELGITYHAFSGDWIHRLTKSNEQKWIIGYSFDINSTAASGLARDKVATYQALKASSIPAIEHVLARSRAMTSVLISNLEGIADSEPVVIKPLEGASGHGVHRFENKSAAITYLEKQPHTDWAMSPWYDIVSETRVTLLDDEVICAYRKLNPATRDGLLLYNLGAGAIANEVSVNNKLTELARQAQRACGLRLCAVDIIQLSSGEVMVLEVNEGIMMEHFARQSDEYRVKAARIYRKIIERMFSVHRL